MACCGNDTICVNLWDACSTSMAGQTVTLSLGGTVIATQTTDSSGHCCFTIGSAGTYTISTTVGGTTYTATRTTGGTCNQAMINICLSGALLSIIVGGCYGIPLNGTTISVSAGTIIGSNLFTGSPVLACVPAATSIDVTASPPSARFVTTVKTVLSGGACSKTNVQFGVDVASGYVCPCEFGAQDFMACAWPVSTTLYITETKYGSTTTLTYDPTSHSWSGRTTISYPGCTVPYSFVSCPSSSFVLAWSVFFSSGILAPCATFGYTSNHCDVSAQFSYLDAGGQIRSECPGLNPFLPGAGFEGAGLSFPRRCASTCPFPEGLDGWDIDICPETGAFAASGRIYIVNPGLPTNIWVNGSCFQSNSITCGGFHLNYTTVGFSISE